MGWSRFQFVVGDFGENISRVLEIIIFQIQNFDIWIIKNVDWDLLEEIFIQINVFQIRRMLFVFLQMCAIRYGPYDMDHIIF